MNLGLVALRTDRPELVGFSASLRRLLGITITALTLRLRRSRDRRNLTRCAALLGHRFATDTLIPYDVTRKPFWDNFDFSAASKRNQRIGTQALIAGVQLWADLLQPLPVIPW